MTRFLIGTLVGSLLAFAAGAAAVFWGSRWTP